MTEMISQIHREVQLSDFNSLAYRLHTCLMQKRREKVKIHNYILQGSNYEAVPSHKTHLAISHHKPTKELTCMDSWVTSLSGILTNKTTSFLSFFSSMPPHTSTHPVALKFPSGHCRL